MRQLVQMKKTADKWRGLEKKVVEMAELVSIAGEEDASLEAELEVEIGLLTTQIDGLEMELALGDEYDSRNAVLALHAGAGGTESQDWRRFCYGCIFAGQSEGALRPNFWIPHRVRRRE